MPNNCKASSPLSGILFICTLILKNLELHSMALSCPHAPGFSPSAVPGYGIIWDMGSVGNLLGEALPRFNTYFHCRVSLLGRRPAIVAGRQGAKTANVADRPMANSRILIPCFDALFISTSHAPNNRKCIRHATRQYVLLLFVSQARQ